MSMLTDVMDRLTDISAMRTIMLAQQRELAEVRGQLNALIQMQSAGSRK
jgi:hypothetical protein